MVLKPITKRFLSPQLEQPTIIYMDHINSIAMLLALPFLIEAVFTGFSWGNSYYTQID